VRFCTQETIDSFDAIFVVDCPEAFGNSVWTWNISYFSSAELDTNEPDKNSFYPYHHPGFTANAYYMDGHVHSFKPMWLGHDRNFTSLYSQTAQEAEN
tara:strand:- start:7304 stop:7597 length:294 start_codon:yes stop_codon:yes gene_type:complete